MTIKAGDVVTAEFPGVTGLKRRPAVIISTATYHSTRPDVMVGLLSSQIAVTAQPSDHLLLDWQAAGLRRPSLFRTFLATLPAQTVTVIGHLSERDWRAVQQSLRTALDVNTSAG